MQCKHNDYDDYFEVCNDCGMSGQQIHEVECKDHQLTEEGCCDRCGIILAEAAK